MSTRYNDQRGCAHGWVHHNVNEGKANSLFFEGPVIYSYGKHFPIAYLDGHRVFFTLQDYSKTTAKHKSIVRSAVSHKEIIYVQYVPEFQQTLTMMSWRERNVNFWVENIKRYLTEFQEHPRKTSLVTKIHEQVQLLTSFINAMQIVESESLMQLLSNPTITAVAAFTAEQQKQKLEQEEKKKNELINAHKINIAKWRAGKLIAIDNPENRNEAYLRYNQSQKRIETSKGIQIPQEIAKRFWQFILQVLPAGCTNCKYSIMDYQVQEISVNHIVIGCHTISMKEVRAMARRLNW